MGSSAGTWAISVAPASRRGSAVNRPSRSVSSRSTSALTRWATSAASRSLSPKRISSLATASFSFTTGTQPRSSRRTSVWRAWRYWRRFTKSWGTISTCAATAWWSASERVHVAIIRGWPRAARACSVGRSAGRCCRPSAATPADTAPELTTTTWWPWPRTSATCWHSSATMASSTWPSSPVSDEVPIFTITRATAQTSGSYSKLKAPMCTTSPACAPARARALATPRRFMRSSM